MKTATLVLCVLFSASFQAQDFNTRVVVKLSEMLKVPVPTKIEIEVVSQEKLQNDYRREQVAMCLHQTNGDFPYCASYAQSLKLFIYGHWEPQGDPTHLKIVLYERAGPDVLIHEFLHWWVHNSTEPKGILNNETNVEGMMKSILSSQEFVEWLGG